jgi:hypothetical protein
MWASAADPGKQIGWRGHQTPVQPGQSFIGKSLENNNLQKPE